MLALGKWLWRINSNEFLNVLPFLFFELNHFTILPILLHAGAVCCLSFCTVPSCFHAFRKRNSVTWILELQKLHF